MRLRIWIPTTNTRQGSSSMPRASVSVAVAAVAVTISFIATASAQQSCTSAADCPDATLFQCDRAGMCEDTCRDGKVYSGGQCVRGPDSGRAHGQGCTRADQCASQLCTLEGPLFNDGRCCATGMSRGCNECGAAGYCFACSLSCDRCDTSCNVTSDTPCWRDSYVQCMQCKPLYVMLQHGGGVAECVPWLALYGTALSFSVGFFSSILGLSLLIRSRHRQGAIVFRPSTAGAVDVFTRGGMSLLGIALEASDVISDCVFLSALATETQAGRSIFVASLGAVAVLWLPGMFSRLRRGYQRRQYWRLFEPTIYLGLFVAAGNQHLVEHDSPSIMFFVLIIIIGGSLALAFIGYDGIKAEIRRSWRHIVSMFCFVRVRWCSTRFWPRTSSLWKVKEPASDEKYANKGWRGALVLHKTSYMGCMYMRLAEAVLESCVAHVVVAFEIQRRPASVLASVSIALSTLSIAKAMRVFLFVPRHLPIFIGCALLMASDAVHIQSSLSVASWTFVNYDLPAKAGAFFTPRHTDSLPTAPPLSIYCFLRWAVCWWLLTLPLCIYAARGSWIPARRRTPCVRALVVANTVLAFAVAIVTPALADALYMFYIAIVPPSSMCVTLLAIALSARFSHQADQAGTVLQDRWVFFADVLDTNLPWVVVFTLLSVVPGIIQDVLVLMEDDKSLRGSLALYLAAAHILLLFLGAVCVAIGACRHRGLGKAAVSPAISPAVMSQSRSSTSNSNSNGGDDDVVVGICLSAEVKGKADGDASAATGTAGGAVGRVSAARGGGSVARVGNGDDDDADRDKARRLAVRNGVGGGSAQAVM